jgi:hypothetical protein
MALYDERQHRGMDGEHGCPTIAPLNPRNELYVKEFQPVLHRDDNFFEAAFFGGATREMWRAKIRHAGWPHRLCAVD